MEKVIEITTLSRTVLYAKLKAITGQGVPEFIKSIRLKKSIELLVEGKLNVSQIAYEVGFTSPFYYIRCFTRQYGLPPKEYIKSYERKVNCSPKSRYSYSMVFI